jgi:hypothetical protein
MKPQKLISVDFRRKTRRNGLNVQKKRDRAFEIGAVGQHVSFSQPGKNFFTRMSVSIARSHRNHSESGMHPVEQ